VLNVYGFRPNDYSSSAVDEEGAPAIRETTFRDCSDNDDGYLMRLRHREHSKQSGSTSRSFEWDSNITDVSNMQCEKEYLHITSTDAGI
jgi:hypothetical protein